MSSENSNIVGDLDFSELRAMLKSCEGDSQERLIEFGSGEKVETEHFTLTIPQGYIADREMPEFEVACYLEDFQTTPLQITVKAEPIVLLSPAEHREELKNSVLNTRGMVMFEAEVDGDKVCRFDIPTLGGKQMFFALYHETEMFSLRINFVGKITNAAEITDKILSSFHFKDFQPRFTAKAVDSLTGVFNYNRDKLRNSFGDSQKELSSSTAAGELCEDYANALFGCFMVLDGEVRKILGWDITAEDMERLRSLGRDFAEDLSFALDYQGETFSVSLGDKVIAMVDRWTK
ncbi:MAG: hypothetical protein Q4C00_06830 [Bacillota bacterium]|nr:hypothetical protein [Bacillota bacterium]